MAGWLVGSWVIIPIVGWKEWFSPPSRIGTQPPLELHQNQEFFRKLGQTKDTKKQDLNIKKNGTS